MENHIIIGLGGTGGKIIREFRKMIYQQFRALEPKDVALGYVYMDSDDTSMNIDDTNWKVLGQSVQLPKESQVILNAGNLKSVLDNVELYPHIHGWIGNKKIWDSILGEIDKVFGGQKRRLGRFLFACNTSKFLTSLGRQYDNVKGKSGSSSVNFSIVCGLAGGTGSGTVIDVVAQIRKKYPDSKVVLHCLLPDRNPKPTWDTGNYHANGYAALMELNAMSVKKYQPFSIDPEDQGRISTDTAFNGCYLFGDTNENGKAVDVAEEIPSVIAAFLYQKIVATRGQNWEVLKRMENAENGDRSPENDYKDKSPERSRRFMSFGIKRVAIPKREIQEYLTFNYARQSLLQLRYNHWSDTQGFLKMATNRSWKAFIEDPKTRTDWKLSDNHLTLSLPILETDEKAKWHRLEVTWNQVRPRFVEMAKETRNSNDWINKLEEYMTNFYNQGFRKVGVIDFYKAKEEDRKDIAREIRQHLERILFESWQNGEYAMSDIRKIIDTLYQDMDVRIGKIEEKIDRLEQAVKNESNKIAENKRTYNNIGIFSDMLGKKDKVLNAQSECLQKYHTYRTQIEAWGFARRLLESLKLELADLVFEIKEVTNTIEKTFNNFEDGIKNRINETTEDLNEALVKFYEPDLVKRVIRKLIQDKKEQQQQCSQVRQHLVDMLGDNHTFTAFGKHINSSFLVDKLQEVCQKSVETAHAELITASNEKVLHGKIVDKIEERYRGKDTDFKKFIDELVKRAGNYVNFDNDEVNRQMPGIMGVEKSKLSAFSFIMPTWNGGQNPASNTFEETLKNTLEQTVPTKTQAKDFLNHDERHEFVIVSLTNLFPIRFVKEVQYLKEKYEKRIATGERAKIEVHTEGDASMYPSLYTLDMNDIRDMEEKAKRRASFLDDKIHLKIDEILTDQTARMTAHLLLGRSTGLIQKDKDKRGNEKASAVLYIPQHDEDGFEIEPIELDKTLVASFEKLKEEVAEQSKNQINAFVEEHFKTEKEAFVVNEMLETEEQMEEALQETLEKIAEEVDDVEIPMLDKIETDVLENLNQEFPDTETRHDSLKPQIMKLVNEVKAERGGSAKDEVYKLFVSGAKITFKILKDEE